VPERGGHAGSFCLGGGCRQRRIPQNKSKPACGRCSGEFRGTAPSEGGEGIAAFLPRLPSGSGEGFAPSSHRGTPCAGKPHPHPTWNDYDRREPVGATHCCCIFPEVASGTTPPPATFCVPSGIAGVCPLLPVIVWIAGKEAVPEPGRVPEPEPTPTASECRCYRSDRGRGFGPTRPSLRPYWNTRIAGRRFGRGRFCRPERSRGTGAQTVAGSPDLRGRATSCQVGKSGRVAADAIGTPFEPKIGPTWKRQRT
jgi:hypothetical protein